MLKLKKDLARKELVCSLSLALFLLFYSSCATYSSLTIKVQESIQKRDFEKAKENLKKVCKGERTNELLCLLDAGMLSYLANDYKNAVKYFLKAEDLASQLDVVSVSEQGASLLLDENSVAYRGEHHEKILISVYLALSFLKQEMYESALVETRKINHKHKLLEQENEKKYKQNAFAKYLSGKIFESQGDYNEAFLYYREANRLEPEITIIQRDLLRMAKKMNFRQEFSYFEKEFGNLPITKTKGYGEIFFILENGLSPKKISQSSSVFAGGKYIKTVAPKFISRSNNIEYAVIKAKKIEGSDLQKEYSSRTYILNDIDKIAKIQLNDRVKIRMAKTVGRLIAKQAVAAGIGKAAKNDLLGAIVGFGLNAMQSADTRSWLSLPSNLQSGSLFLPPGKYEVVLDFYNKSKKFTFSVASLPQVEIGSNETKFISWRTFE
jgi:uncharacterized protein